MAVVDLDLIEADDPFIDFDGALLLEDEFFLVVQRLLGNGVAVPGVVISLKVHLRLGEEIGVAFERALGLEKGSFVGACVDVDQRIAFAHELAFFVVDRRDDSIDLTGDRSCVNGRDRADGIQIDADVTFFCICGDQTDGATATARGFRGGRRSVALAQDKIESAGKYQEQNNPHESADTFVPGGCIGCLVFRTRGRANVLISRQVGDPLSIRCYGLRPESPYSIDGNCGFLDTVVSVNPDAGSLNQLGAASLV